MMIKFFSYGRGGGSGPVDYVCGTHRHKALKRLPAPQILGGEPAVIRQVIDSVPHKYKYTSGVLSFAPEDAPTSAQQAEAMRLFELAAFPGMECDRYCILWVRHLHKGRIELHFVTPRIDLLSDRAYNPAPPGWRHRYDPLRDMLNYRYGWARPDDPARARPVQPGIEHLIAADSGTRTAMKSLKEKITEEIIAEIQQGKMHNRQDIISFLTNKGFSLPRIGTDYITIMNSEGKRHRLKGKLFEENFCVDNYSCIKRESITFIDEKKAQQAEAIFVKELKKASAYNIIRYENRRQSDDGRDQQTQNTPRGIGETGNGKLYEVMPHYNRYQQPNERSGLASEYLVGSGGKPAWNQRRTSGKREFGRQDGKPQNFGGCSQCPAEGHAGTQGNRVGTIESIHQRALRMILTTVLNLRDESLFLRRHALQAKLQLLPKVLPHRTSFAGMMGEISRQLDSLRAEAVVFKRAVLDRRLEKIRVAAPHIQRRDLLQLLCRYFHRPLRILQTEAVGIHAAVLHYQPGRGKMIENAVVPRDSVEIEWLKSGEPEADALLDTVVSLTPAP